MSSSLLYPGEIIIDEDTPNHILDALGIGFGTGWVKNESDGYGVAADDFPDGMLLPEQEIKDRIKEREANKNQLSHKMIAKGIPCKNQEDTWFCYVNAVAHCLEVMGVMANQPYVPLSAASVACQINGFTKYCGGFAGKALSVIQGIGILPEEYWPANSVDRSYNTKENWKKAVNYIVAKWCSLEPGNILQMASLNVQDIPGGVAYQWWPRGAHEVTSYDAIILDGEIAFRDRNSWGMQWTGGVNGFFIVRGQHARFDDGVACLSIGTGLAV